jgi:hypothetical protein
MYKKRIIRNFHSLLIQIFHVYMYIYKCIYIYNDMEREDYQEVLFGFNSGMHKFDIFICIYVYIYIYIYMYIYVLRKDY